MPPTGTTWRWLSRAYGISSIDTMDKKLTVLVVGGGGREHALVWKLAQSPHAGKIFCAPGNAGIAKIAECVPLAAEDVKGLLAFAKKQRVDLTVVGPEVPLAAGIADVFRKARLAVFGPSRKAAMLETSKVFAKRLMKKYHVPTADFKVFEQSAKALAYLKKAAYPLVLKADGLAAGKGVVIAKSFEQAKAAVQDIMVKKVHGRAGKKLLIEECLSGPEVSVLALTDGKSIKLLPTAQDHKRVFDNDEGPNTGGMGAYSPAAILDEQGLERVQHEILEAMLRAMRLEKRPFNGVLYAGLMLTPDGPKVLEFNARFGDPETQVLLPRVQGDLLDILLACAKGKLADKQVTLSPEAAVCVVLAAKGYPGAYPKGQPIFGLEQAHRIPGVTVFHAGTSQENGTVKTAGGRVLGVTALGATLPDAIARAYQAADLISFEGVHFRRDIAAKALSR